MSIWITTQLPSERRARPETVELWHGGEMIAADFAHIIAPPSDRSPRGAIPGGSIYISRSPHGCSPPKRLVATRFFDRAHKTLQPGSGARSDRKKPSIARTDKPCHAYTWGGRFPVRSARKSPRTRVRVQRVRF